MIEIVKNTIRGSSGIKSALQRLNGISVDSNGNRLPLTLFVVDGDKRLTGTLTDGDIRRGLLGGKQLGDPVSSIMNSDFHYLTVNEDGMKAVTKYRNENIELVPVVNTDMQIIKVLDLTCQKSMLPLHAVVMAGGKGKRLRPLTEEIPKPLLKIGNKSIIKYIIERMEVFGVDNVTVSTGYRSEQLIASIQNDEWSIKIDFLKEEKPLGTMGALTLIDQFEQDHILLMNADLLTTIDLEQFYQHFIQNEADFSVACVPYNVTIPYGIFEVNGVNILSIREKPELKYYSNGGIYLFKKELADRIPANKYYEVTDFMEELIAEDFKVTYFPIYGYWQDIGRHEDFKKVQRDIKLIDI